MFAEQHIRSGRLPTGKVYRGRSDKDWAELIKYREELKQEQLRKEQELLRIKNEVHPYLMLRIVYSVQIETHNGHCNDTDEFTTVHRTITEVVGLPTIFEKGKSINNLLFSTIPTNDKLLQQLFAKHKASCDRGSEYCDCKTTYHIRSATIIRSSKWKHRSPYETVDFT